MSKERDTAVADLEHIVAGFQDVDTNNSKSFCQQCGGKWPCKNKGCVIGQATKSLAKMNVSVR